MTCTGGTAGNRTSGASGEATVLIEAAAARAVADADAVSRAE